MSELSKAAKVSRQTLYNYFPDLESVLGAWMEQEADMLYQEIREKTESLENPLE
jgi:AcrR family transcriptional regulator